MIQKFIVTIDSNENITSKEVSDALNYGIGSFSLGDNKDDVILAKAIKVKNKSSK